MKAATMARIIDTMIDSEVVRFEDCYGMTFEVFKIKGFYEVSARDRQGFGLMNAYFNRFEADGSALKLYWGNDLVGFLYAERLSKE